MNHKTQDKQCKCNCHRGWIGTGVKCIHCDPTPQEKQCHCLEALSGGKHHAHCPQSDRSFFDMTDTEKKEIVDKAAEDSNKAQRELMEQSGEGMEERLDGVLFIGNGIVSLTKEEIIEIINQEIALARKQEREKLRKPIREILDELQEAEDADCFGTQMHSDRIIKLKIILKLLE